MPRFLLVLLVSLVEDAEVSTIVKPESPIILAMRNVAIGRFKNEPMVPIFSYFGMTPNFHSYAQAHRV